MTILEPIESGSVELLSSEALQFELNRTTDAARKEAACEIFKLADEVIEIVEEIETHAEALVAAGIKPMDALHVATASWAKADFFCTCDDRLLKKCKKVKNLDVEVVSPVQLIAEIEP